ncbi:MAG: T9SS type A sorting domain-containing protein [Bacteroidota bacterium]
MKKTLHLFTKIVWLVTVLIVLTGNTAFSQEEIVVDPGFNTLNDAVLANPGATFILKRGAEYVNDVSIEIKESTIIKGETGPEDLAPAILRFYADPGEAVGKWIFTLGADATFMDIGIQGYGHNNEQINGFLKATAPGITIITDGCIYQGVNWQILTGGAKGMHIIAKNNIYFNLCTSRADGGDNLGGLGPLWGGDSMIVEHTNNTYFVGGRTFGNSGSGPSGTQYMDHNSYIATWGDLFFPVTDENFILKNCLLYDAEVRGYVGERKDPVSGEVIWAGDYIDWDFKGDTMSGNFAIYPHKKDTVGGPRTVEVTNNLKMYSQHVLDFYEANNVTPMTFTNVQNWILAEKYGWNLTHENNWLQEDSTEIDPMLPDLPEGVYANMFLQRQERSLPSEQQGPEFPYETAWWPNNVEPSVFIWPLPFNLKPSNEAVYALGDDGYPIGDLNWFGERVVEAWENGESSPVGIKVEEAVSMDLSLTTYPNPFSSITRIKYELPARSHVILKIYDVAGNEVITLVNENQLAGEHELNFNGEALAGGFYFCRIVAGNLTQVHKMILIN